jgi:hypothetical protein
MVENSIERVQRVWIQSVLSENVASEVALQRRKAKAISPITFENELNQPVAKSADTVVKNYRKVQRRASIQK